MEAHAEANFYTLIIGSLIQLVWMDLLVSAGRLGRGGTFENINAACTCGERSTYLNCSFEILVDVGLAWVLIGIRVDSGGSGSDRYLYLVEGKSSFYSASREHLQGFYALFNGLD